MLVAQPPYALTPPAFRFNALASLAGRAAIGGRREIALATYLAARLAQDALPDREIPQASRVERCAHAKQWLAALALPASVRPALVDLIDASSKECADVSKGLQAAIAAVTESLDKNARAELVDLAAALDASNAPQITQTSVTQGT
ncbi:MAG: hypothetical protein ABI442_09010 [Gemmatimonadaceae bacterium]